MSLKSDLNNYIKLKGRISFQEMSSFCAMSNRKVSNGERRLRRSESPFIKPIENEKGAIVGYEWDGPEEKKEAKELQTSLF